MSESWFFSADPKDKPLSRWIEDDDSSEERASSRTREREDGESSQTNGRSTSRDQAYDDD